MMKKVLSLTLALVFIFTVASPCFAATSTDDIDTALIERGYPSDVLSRMDESHKLMIYQDPNWFYGGSNSIRYSEAQNNTGIQPYGQIPVSDLTLYFDLSYGVYDGVLEQIFVQFYYTWNNIPTFRFQDPIAISWDESKFKLKDDSFYKVDKFTGFYTYEPGVVTWLRDEVHSLETGYAIASPSGVSWYADLKGNIGVTVTELYGYGYFFLEPAHNVTVYEGDTSTLYAHYVHPTASLGASIAVASYGSFDISCLGGYDERGTQISFEIIDMTEE